MLDTSLSSAYFSPKLSSKNIQSKNESDCINFPFSHLHVIKVLAVKNRIINLIKVWRLSIIFLLIKQKSFKNESTPNPMDRHLYHQRTTGFHCRENNFEISLPFI